MQNNWHKRTKWAAEIALGLGTLNWVMRLGRSVLEAISDAQTIAIIARHSAQVGQAIVAGVDWFFSPVGSGFAIVISGGYLWIDNRRHKRDTMVPQLPQPREATVAQPETPPLVIASPIPDLPAVVVNAEVPRLIQPEEERIFIELTPRELVAPFEAQVQIQAEKTVLRYIGKWYRVNGSVSQIHRYSDCWTVRFFTVDPGHIFGVQIALEFPLSLSERIELLDRDSPIAAIGQIAEIGDSFITLKRCEFAT